MMAGFRHYSDLRILAFVFVWLLTGAGAFSDSLDLSDDVGIPQSLQAVSVGDADEVKQGFSLVRSPTHFPPTLSEFGQEHFHSFIEFLRLLQTRPSALFTPLYESLCDYRL